MGEPNTAAAIDRLNLLWADLLRAYAIKAKLPLANLDKTYNFISADWDYAKVELRAYFEQWRGLLTGENLAAFRTITREISGLRQKLNMVIFGLCMDGFAVVSIDDFTTEDLMLFNENTRSLAPMLAEVKKKKGELIKAQQFGEVCGYRVEEKVILGEVADQFAKNNPGLYFKASWYREKEVIFWPTGSKYDMKGLVKRAARETYKSN